MVMDDSREDIELAEAGLQRRLVAAEGWDDSCEAAAREYARLMVAAGIEQQETLCRLEAAGIAPKWAWEILSAAEKQAEEAELAGATPVCPHCLTPVGQFDHFCPKCAGPITAIASFDPMGQIYSTGRAYQRAVTGRPRFFVVLAMWLIFGPQVVTLLFGICAISLVRGSDRYGFMGSRQVTFYGNEVLALLLMLGFLALYSAILWKVTVRWVRARGKPEDDGQAEAGQESDRQAEASDQ